MDSYLVVGFIVALIVTMFLMKKMYSGNKLVINDAKVPQNNVPKGVVVICKAGPKSISKEALVDMIAQFKNNIVQAMRIVDFDNCHELEISMRMPMKNLHNWINEQTDNSFKKTKEYSTIFQEDDIENEKQQLDKKIVSITDFMYNSKKESEAPVEDSKDDNTTGESNASPIKTKNLLAKLSQDLNMVNVVMIRCDCTVDGTLDIRPFEKLMDKIAKNIRQIIVRGEHGTKKIAPRDGRLMRNNSKIMSCYNNECGLNESFLDSASVVLGKNRTSNKYFPQIDTNMNKFSTIVR